MVQSIKASFKSLLASALDDSDSTCSCGLFCKQRYEDVFHFKIGFYGAYFRQWVFKKFPTLALILAMGRYRYSFSLSTLDPDVPPHLREAKEEGFSMKNLDVHFLYL